MKQNDPTFHNIQPEFPFFEEYDTQLEFPFILQDDYNRWLQNPTDTHLKSEVIRSITAQNTENVLGIVGEIHLKNKVLIQLINKFAWPYNRKLLNTEAITYIDQNISGDTLKKIIGREMSKFEQGEITFSVFLGNIQRNFQESNAITTAQKDRTGQV